MIGIDLMKTDPHGDTQLPYLATFAKVAETGSFTAAAKVLGLTQAAVSQRIHAVEKALGTALFRRQSGRAMLTEAGLTVHEYARRIIDLHREVRQKVTGKSVPISGALILGASTIPGEHFLPTILSIFHKRYPKIEVRARISDSMEVIRQVQEGEVHLGLVGRRSDNPNLDFRYLATDRMVLVVPARHAWRRRRQVTLQQLCKLPLVLREPGSGLRYCFEKELARMGKSLRDLDIALELGSNEAIKKAVMKGLGVAVLSSHAVRKELKTGQLIGVKVTNLHCDREMFIVQDRRRVHSTPAGVFLNFLQLNPIA